MFPPVMFDAWMTAAHQCFANHEMMEDERLFLCATALPLLWVGKLWHSQWHTPTSGANVIPAQRRIRKIRVPGRNEVPELASKPVLPIYRRNHS
jgi:hypothetical protein